LNERKCDITGKRKNSKAMSVSKSGIRTHRTQGVNLQTKKLWWDEGRTYVRMKLAVKTLRTIKKKGLVPLAKDYNINLKKFTISCSGSERKNTRDNFIPAASANIPSASSSHNVGI
jgi:large subunit ribosomal protein L28